MQKLVNSLALPKEPKIEVKIIKANEINAFAFPGGKIIIFDELINVAENESEIAGVVAHEAGHVIMRHPTTSLIRGLWFQFITDNGT